MDSPAGCNGCAAESFANIINRFVWTADSHGFVSMNPPRIKLSRIMTEVVERLFLREHAKSSRFLGKLKKIFL